MDSKRNIFVQIGIARTCELDFLTLPHSVENYKSEKPFIGISYYKDAIPIECIENKNSFFVIGVDMNPKSIAIKKEEYYQNPNIDFLHYAVIGDDRKFVETNGWSFQNESTEQFRNNFRKNFPELAIENTVVPAISLHELLVSIQHQYNGEIVGVIMDVEGEEANILEFYNWQICPHFFTIEGHKTEVNQRCLQKLLSVGYNLLDYSIVGTNWVAFMTFIRQDIQKYNKMAGDFWNIPGYNIVY